MRHPQNRDSRLTDELLLFLFDIDNININVLDNVNKIDEMLNYCTESDKISY